MRICMLLHKSVVHDSRVRREAKALAAAGHEVTVVQLAEGVVPPEAEAEGYRVVSALPRGGHRRLPLALHRLSFMRRFVGAVLTLRPDVVHAHDAAMLAPGYVGARLTGARLVYDSHELATGVAYRGRAWASFVWTLERTLIRRTDAVITVSEGIARRLKALYRLPAAPTVVRNLCALPPPNGSVDLRGRLALDRAPIVLHQGAAAMGRGCELLVDAMRHVPGAHLVFLGDGDPGYGELLAEQAARLGISDRVHFHPSVPLDQLLSYTAEADVGLSLLEDSCENHRLALPNKVFEYVAAEVPVVVSPLPELAALVQSRRVGWVVPSHEPSDLAATLTHALSSSRAGERRESLREARQALVWRSEATRLLDLYARLEWSGPGQRAAVA